jgi:hypothetical protein
MGLHKTKELLHSKGNSHQTQETAQRMGEKSLSDTHPIRDEIYKELRKLNPQRMNTSMKKWAHELNSQFSNCQ